MKNSAANKLKQVPFRAVTLLKLAQAEVAST